MSAPASAPSGMKLHTKILLGLLTGGVLGVLANWLLGPEHGLVNWVNTYLAGPVGQVFLRLLFMIVMPLVFASIALGVAGMGDLRRIGRVGGKALAYFLITTVLAALMGIAMVVAVRPGSRIEPAVVTELQQTYASDAASRIETSEQQRFGIETLVNIVTRNPLRSAVEMDMLGVIFFGLMFGVGLTMIREERATPMIDILQALLDVVIKIVEIAMKLAPYGVAGLIFGVTSRFGWELLRPLGNYVAIVLIALALHVLITIALIVRVFAKMSPIVFFRRIRASLVTAFSTSSSAATLPTNIAVAEQNLGVPPKIAGFVLPLGATMCMNGTSLFEGITVIFLAQVFGITFSVTEMAVVMAMAVVTAVGAAGVPGGSIPLLVGILAMFGVPGEGIALILGVDRILDMSRTVVNIIGDLSATVVIARSEGIWDPSMIPAVEMGAADIPLDESPGWPERDPMYPDQRLPHQAPPKPLL